MNDLAEIKKVNKSDLKAFLVQDHTSFSVLSVSTKHIESTNRISVTLSKNSAQSFYLGKSKTPLHSTPSQPKLKDDCLQDAQNCTYFQFFNSKEKKLYTRFNNKSTQELDKYYSSKITAEDIFFWYDTKGMPVKLIQFYLENKGHKFPEKEFAKLLEQQKEKGHKDREEKKVSVF